MPGTAFCARWASGRFGIGILGHQVALHQVEIRQSLGKLVDVPLRNHQIVAGNQADVRRLAIRIVQRLLAWPRRVVRLPAMMNRVRSSQ